MDHDDDWILFRLQRLKPSRFEDLCFALLRAKGHTEITNWGASGADGGVDLLSTAQDGKRWVTQCKRTRSLSKADAKPELQKVIDNPPQPPPERYRLMATCTVSRETDEALQAKAKVEPSLRLKTSSELQHQAKIVEATKRPIKPPESRHKRPPPPSP